MFESDEESESCCVGGKDSPADLANCLDLVIVKWDQCDKCEHWTDLCLLSMSILNKTLVIALNITCTSEMPMLYI